MPWAPNHVPHKEWIIFFDDRLKVQLTFTVVNFFFQNFVSVMERAAHYSDFLQL